MRFQSNVQAVAGWLELTEPQAKRLIAYLAANHDCYGKAAPGFQKKVPALAEPFIRVEMISIRDESEYFRYELYGARRYAAEAGAFAIPSIPARIFASTVIEAPMGEGKTEAGAFQATRLCGLWGKQGVYYALPTAATSNQMHARIEAMLSSLGMGGARLMHSMAWLVERRAKLPENADADDREVAYDWLQPLRRAMLAESAVGTVDQAMMAAMPVKYSCLRLLGLTGKVLVIDEIHAYDAYMSRIIKRLLEWGRVLRVPVLLLSATLTAKKRRALVEAYGGRLEEIDGSYPLITQVSAGATQQIPVDGCARVGRFHFRPLALWRDARGIARRAVERVARGGCLCVLMNTVAGAQAVWREAREIADPDAVVLLFHARFKAKVRDELERRCV